MIERERRIMQALETLEAYAADIMDMVAIEKAAILCAESAPNGDEVSNTCSSKNPVTLAAQRFPLENKW